MRQGPGPFGSLVPPGGNFGADDVDDEMDL